MTRRPVHEPGAVWMFVCQIQLRPASVYVVTQLVYGRDFDIERVHIEFERNGALKDCRGRVPSRLSRSKETRRIEELQACAIG